jgi:transposase InsO family protein
MNDEIKFHYEENNYPSATRLYKILKQEGVANVTLSKVKEFLNDKEETQLTKVVFNSKNNRIIAFYPYEFVNIDIFVLDKYETANKGYKYILCMIDIFSRFVNAVPMRNKDEETVLKAFQLIIHETKIIPTNIISDSDSSFLSKRFQAYIEEGNINFIPVAINDHHALGVLDRFALTLKRILTKYRIANKDANWVNILEKVIKIYNNTPHTALLKMTPSQALEKINFDFIQSINLIKNKGNDNSTDLVNGDKVRILEKKVFKKGSEPIWSDEVFIVESARGQTVILTNGKKKNREQLLKVPRETLSSGPSIDKIYAKKRRIKRRMNKEGLDASNIIQGGRRRN